MLKTFWCWRDEQHPDGTVVWRCPQGQTYTTHPGSRLPFPTLCRPTAPITVRDIPTTSATDEAARTAAMPRRATIRARNRAQAIDDERRVNHTLIQVEAEQGEQIPEPGTDLDSAYFPTRPPPPIEDDPPPF